MMVNFDSSLDFYYAHRLLMDPPLSLCRGDQTLPLTFTKDQSIIIMAAPKVIRFHNP